MVPEAFGSEYKHIKVLVNLDLKNPLERGTLSRHNGKEVWVEFRYEQLPNFCYYCGCIGHLERSCECRMKDIDNNCVTKDQFGPWLRVGYRRRELRDSQRGNLGEKGKSDEENKMGHGWELEEGNDGNLEEMGSVKKRVFEKGERSGTKDNGIRVKESNKDEDTIVKGGGTMTNVPVSQEGVGIEVEQELGVTGRNNTSRSWVEVVSGHGCVEGLITLRRGNLNNVLEQGFDVEKDSIGIQGENMDDEGEYWEEELDENSRVLTDITKQK
ncbi:OLC1v1036112C1 [Oldenlandia corymbosa var. corymbosa]|uniref:OLC1v1036112C1 n=1 Tax=Oldenlandia corymbosa var. corymbosa TaxID=529605 RepID=A0AAV1CXS9_OLDCO|nr:OLC1v1036112C1 [Oldenlandia corymbosa var. corymbosa]